MPGLIFLSHGSGRAVLHGSRLRRYHALAKSWAIRSGMSSEAAAASATGCTTEATAAIGPNIAKARKARAKSGRSMAKAPFGATWGAPSHALAARRCDMAHAPKKTFRAQDGSPAEVTRFTPGRPLGIDRPKPTQRGERIAKTCK